MGLTAKNKLQLVINMSNKEDIVDSQMFFKKIKNPNIINIYGCYTLLYIAMFRKEHTIAESWRGALGDLLCHGSS